MVIWTNNAILHITDFVKEAKNGTEEVAKEYILKLIDYVDTIETMPKIGKKVNYNATNYEIRQIIYKKH